MNKQISSTYQPRVDSQTMQPKMKKRDRKRRAASPTKRSFFWLLMFFADNYRDFKTRMYKGISFNCPPQPLYQQRILSANNMIFFRARRAPFAATAGPDSRHLAKTQRSYQPDIFRIMHDMLKGPPAHSVSAITLEKQSDVSHIKCDNHGAKTHSSQHICSSSKISASHLSQICAQK